MVKIDFIKACIMYFLKTPAGRYFIFCASIVNATLLLGILNNDKNLLIFAFGANIIVLCYLVFIISAFMKANKEQQQIIERLFNRK